MFQRILMPLDGSAPAQRALTVAARLARALESGLQRWVMGSVTERVLSASKLPLLVVRPKEVADTHRFHADPTAKEVVPS